MKGKAQETDAPPHPLVKRPKPLGKMMIGVERGGSRNVMMHDGWGVGRLGAALSNLHPQATPQPEEEEEVWYPGARLRGRLPNTAYKWREMTVK